LFDGVIFSSMSRKKLWAKTVTYGKKSTTNKGSKVKKYIQNVR